MPLLETKGAGSAQGFGLSLGSAEAVYIEDVFSTYLYNGNATAQTITNGIDLAGEGGLVWIKTRQPGIGNYHALFDTNRGNTSVISSNATDAANAYGTPNVFASFNSDGFSLNATDNYGWVNSSGISQVSWTFRKQPKFFDIVTYTGTGTDPLTLNHNLQSVPGVIIIKCTSAVTNWRVHSAAVNASLVLNLTNAGFSPDGLIKNLTSTTFQVNNSADVNSSGATYVAYLFAHNAGGFGLTGTDNVISCGSYTGNGSATGPVITLGYEPQWVMIKRAVGGTGNWVMFDSMRGFTVSTVTGDKTLFANTSAEEDSGNLAYPTATGFGIEINNTSVNETGDTYIYIAIRRGPMKVPTSGTEVFTPYSSSSTTLDSILYSNFPVDLMLSGQKNSNNSGANWSFVDRLRGSLVSSNSESGARQLLTTSTAAETSLTYPNAYNWWNSTLVQGYGLNGASVVYHFFRRAPGFFDEVCWSATAASTQNHNLQVVPELAIFKYRTSTSNWWVYSAPVGLGAGRGMYLNGTDSSFSGVQNPITAISSTTFTTGLFFGGGGNWVTYLFATVAGVSKVGSYTGTGTTQVINCGFTAGSRFVMIKRTDSTGDWYVWDSARGIVAGNDPYLLLNSDAAEVTSTDYVDTAATGFEISSTAPAAINANGGTFIFLAIA